MSIGQKLTSRKLWLTILAVATALAVPGVPAWLRIVATVTSTIAYKITETVLDSGGIRNERERIYASDGQS